MQRKHTLIPAAIAIVILLIISTTSNTTSLTWRKVLHKSTDIAAPYQAPIYGCDGPEKDRVPHKYAVFLHHGCSLEQHKRAVGEGADLDSAIKFVFPETPWYGLYYSAELDDSALSAVRADLVVDMVECVRRVYEDPSESTLDE